MTIEDMFEVGSIMEPEDKLSGQVDLNGDDCVIMSKGLNKDKIILRMERKSDGIQGNVFVRLKEEHKGNFAVSRKLLGSQKVNGLTLGEFKVFPVENL
jgi:hypothetical protein